MLSLHADPRSVQAALHSLQGVDRDSVGVKRRHLVHLLNSNSNTGQYKRSFGAFLLSYHKIHDRKPAIIQCRSVGNMGSEENESA